MQSHQSISNEGITLVLGNTVYLPFSASRTIIYSKARKKVVMESSIKWLGIGENHQFRFIWGCLNLPAEFDVTPEEKIQHSKEGSMRKPSSDRADRLVDWVYLICKDLHRVGDSMEQFCPSFIITFKVNFWSLQWGVGSLCVILLHPTRMALERLLALPDCRGGF